MSAERSRAPEPGPVRSFEFPRVERSALESGLAVLSAQSGTLPLVTVRAVLDAGATAERRGEEGLAWLTAQALDGGTAARSGEALAWQLERLGAQLSTSATWDAAHVFFSTRSDRLGEALDLLAEIVRRPAFPEREIERLRGEQLADMLQRRSDPRALGDDAAARYIFAEEQTYGRTVLGLEAVVGHLTADAARAFHDRHYRPGRAAIVVVGAVDAGTVRREVARAFSGWTGEGATTDAPGTTARHDRTTVHIVDRPSAVQSELRIGHVGVPRHHDDYYPLLVMNAIIGGAFTSRLNLNLREKHGFTYGVRSAFAFRRAAGPFVIQTAVASDVTARAVEETLYELRRLCTDGVTDEEVRSASDYLAGTLPLEMQTTQQLAARVAELHTFDLPADYFESFGNRLRAVTADDVMHAARKHLQLDRLAVVCVGNADAIENDLVALGIGDVIRHDAEGVGAADGHAATTGDTTERGAAPSSAAEDQ
jgi:zinc protease